MGSAPLEPAQTHDDPESQRQDGKGRVQNGRRSIDGRIEDVGEGFFRAAEKRSNDEGHELDVSPEEEQECGEHQGPDHHAQGEGPPFGSPAANGLQRGRVHKEQETSEEGL